MGNIINGDIMKNKYFTLILIGFIFLVGCTLGNTPTARVEDLLGSYQRLDDGISFSYTNLTDDVNLGNDIRKGYEEAIKKQYRNLSYEIKDEVIDGDNAIVTVRIEVMNYKEVIDKYDRTDYEAIKYHELVLEALDNVKEMVVYTIDISLTKDNGDNWVVDDFSGEVRDKLLGLY